MIARPTGADGKGYLRITISFRRFSLHFSVALTVLSLEMDMKRSTVSLVLISIVALAALRHTSGSSGQAAALAQAPNEAPPSDALTRLGQQLERGETTLEYRDRFGYLPSLLEHLKISIDSQTLVFSKTSFQQAIINPKNPRAVYFNDEVSVGSVPGGDVYELLALEPTRGMVFYTLDIEQTDQPRLRRRGVECLFCHALGNKGAPSMVVASVFPDKDGIPAYTSTFIDTIDHRTPLDQRWGGWYVTGTHGSQRHLGNGIAADPLRPLDLELANSQNLTTLADRFDVSKYPTATSDIVALMTLEHQVGTANRLNALIFQYARARRDGVSDADWTGLDADIDDLVGYMLFVDEAPLSGPVKGVSAFTLTFPQRGPRDKQGRSLRDFDLQKRLFRYPMSYMVYSDLFDGLPASLRERVYRVLHDVLTGKDVNPKYASLSSADRQAILDILLDTKQGLPAYWDDTTSVS
jgi:hypothetical protein